MVLFSAFPAFATVFTPSASAPLANISSPPGVVPIFNEYVSPASGVFSVPLAAPDRGALPEELSLAAFHETNISYWSSPILDLCMVIPLGAFGLLLLPYVFLTPTAFLSGFPSKNPFSLLAEPSAGPANPLTLMYTSAMYSL